MWGKMEHGKIPDPTSVLINVQQAGQSVQTLFILLKPFLLELFCQFFYTIYNTKYSLPDVFFF